MSRHVHLHNFDTRKHASWMAIVGEELDLRPDDARFPATYAVTTAPEGSAATFTGPRITPDVAGTYKCTVIVGDETVKVRIFA
ncbi:MAG TPA: hypothetical protein VHS09_07770, partial [Polyangiaceae bacterium]|nr:hypothetical protein [Polyangiaceae bacterium]